MIIYFVGSSYEKSGVYSLGKNLNLYSLGEVLLVLLDNISMNDKTEAVISIPIEFSHRPKYICEEIFSSKKKWDKRIFILPNNSSSAYEATRKLQARFRSIDVTPITIGIIHSNTASSFDLVSSNYFMIDKLYGVSKKIVTQFNSTAKPGGICALLECPIFIPDSLRLQDKTRGDRSLLNIIYVGRLIDEQKKFTRVMRLVKVLRSFEIKFRLTIVGDGHLLNDLIDLASCSSTTPPDIFFTGAVPHEHAVERISTADILILTSDFEGSPLVVMEAMAVGTVPVVMDYGPEATEVITDGEDGIIVTQGSVDDMARAIIKLASDHKVLRELSESARIKARDFNTPEYWLKVIYESGNIVQLFDNNGRSSYKKIHHKIQRGVRLLDKRSKILIWGGGHIGRLIIDELVSGNHEIAGCIVVDRVLYKYILNYRDVPYYSDAKITGDDFDVAIVASEYYSKEIMPLIEDLKIKCNSELQITDVTHWK